MGEKFYITTAIPYVNAPPHIGHALEFIQTDVIARYHRLIGDDVFFLTGTDENAQKNVLAAEKRNISVKKLVDANSAEFQKVLKILQISNDGFIRTSDENRHWPGVKELWKRCREAGDIYKKKYTGLYCVGCEAFVKEKDLKNGLCPEHLKPPEKVTEENYFFRLSKYQKKLEELIEKDVIKIIPKTRKNEVMSFIRSGLEDFSISRPTNRMRGWGIKVPDDPTQTIYVWFDALTNYLTGLGFGTRDDNLYKKYWPADIHVIGKGIVRFHAVYWPAMLLSAGLPLPKCIFVHGYVTVEGQKMSKSLGNVVNPIEMVEKYGVNALRYYMIREIPPFDDGDFSEALLVKRVNEELVGNIGNFIYRTLTFIYRYFNGIIPRPGEFIERDKELIKEIENSPKTIGKLIEEFRLKKSIQEILSLSASGNKYFQDNRPWELIKSNRERSNTVLYICANLCRTLSILLYPFLPEAAEDLWNQLNLKEEMVWRDAGLLKLKPGHRINKPHILFKKIKLRK